MRRILAVALVALVAGCGSKEPAAEPQPPVALDAAGQPIPANATLNATPPPPPLVVVGSTHVALDGESGWVALNLSAPQTLALAAVAPEGAAAPAWVALLRDARTPACGPLPEGWAAHSSRLDAPPAWTVPAGDWRLYVARSGPAEMELRAGEASGTPSLRAALQPAPAPRALLPYVAPGPTGASMEEPVAAGVVLGRFDPAAPAYGPTSVTRAALRAPDGATCLAAETSGPASPLYGGVDARGVLPEGGAWVASHDGVRTGSPRAFGDWIPLGWEAA